MSSPDPQPSTAVRGPTVFLSYASEDRAAALGLRDALSLHGLEVWYDEAELSGGDAWDQKLRQQIRECDYFMALISAQTQARHEGYFRREWRLAAERSLDMSDDHLFLLPVVIDGTPQSGARVPEKFLSVQWTRVPGGQPNKPLEALCRRLLAGEAVEAPAPAQPAAGSARGSAGPVGAGRPMTLSVELPPFPQRQSGQDGRYVREVCGWYLRSGWQLYRGLPRPWQVLIAVVIFFAIAAPLMSSQDDDDEASEAQESAGRLLNPQTSAELGQQIGRLVQSAKSAAAGSTEVPLLAIPFNAPGGDAQARTLADTAFAQVFGRLALSYHGHASLSDKPMPFADDASVLKRAREANARYALFGTVAGSGSSTHLTVRILKAADGAEIWSKSYPAEGIDAAAIAADAGAQLPPDP